MKLSRFSQTVLATLALLLGFEAVPKLQVILLTIQPVFAQSETTPAVPEGIAGVTKVSIDGSSSMEKINEALKQKFESQNSGAQVNLSNTGTDEALQALKNDQVDLAAIGRPLTDAEKAEGLVEVPVRRSKIAIIVSPDSPFDGNLTIDQFAQIFRGEVTNWDQVGGPSAPVRIVDRSESSDTRQAFASYPVFQNAPLQAGPDAVQVSDDTSAVIEALGPEGVGYAIVDQVENQPGVRIVRMHETLPDDPRYPFSQPLAYVYRGPEPNPNAAAYLGYATNPENQGVIEAAGTQAVVPAETPTPVATATPTATPTAEATVESTETPVATTTPEARVAESAVAEERRGGFPWWLLLLPLLGLPLLLLRRGEQAAPAPVPTTPAAVPPPPVARRSQMILTPRDCRDAYAYWELSDADEAVLRRAGNHPALRLYDVTGIDINQQQPHSMKQFDCEAFAQDMHIPIAQDDRDYLAELGYTTEDGRWVNVARSEHVRVPQCPPLEDSIQGRVGTVAPMATAATAGIAALGISQVMPRGETALNYPLVDHSDGDRIILVPRDASDVYAYWEIPEAEKATLRQQGGRDLKLRLYDVTGIDINQQAANSIREFDCSEIDCDRHMPIYESDRDYLVELGYITDDGRWLKLARSAHVHVPASGAATH
ncbi:MAG: DUF4912 domain-containing protein [Oscillatoriales cyanobacterium RM2_1_1]|nr:DUF4912 domain-containing protein [Oscillatoriales cyanobacterium SM2_3_0]NJO45076.1 DUF4912 domain-containing protein [Oscillatoriales cyanobacterium RM2_1_1]